MPLSFKRIKILTDTLTEETKEELYTKEEKEKVAKMREALGNIEK